MTIVFLLQWKSHPIHQKFAQTLNSHTHMYIYSSVHAEKIEDFLLYVRMIVIIKMRLNTSHPCMTTNYRIYSNPIISRCSELAKGTIKKTGKLKETRRVTTKTCTARWQIFHGNWRKRKNKIKPLFFLEKNKWKLK